MKQFGLAKAHFLATHQCSPWNATSVQNLLTTHDWPLFEMELKNKRISYFDYMLTQRLLRNLSSVKEAVAFFLCHLIMAGKNGHLCVEISESRVVPSVSQLWNNEGSQSLIPEELGLFTRLIQQGALSIPPTLVTNTKKFSSYSGQPHTPLCQCDHHFYLQKHWVFESLFLQHFISHLEIQPSVEIKLDQVKMDLKQMQASGELNQEQALSILQACVNPVTLITGGPGTGKSYTAGKLMSILRKNLKSDDPAKFQIVLTAPTGKAATNLKKSLEKMTSSEFPIVQAKTLHSLLNMHRSQNEASPLGLNADLVVVDECSMIDIELMSRLFESLKKGSRLILLGDPHQLPSIGAGSVFIDLNKLYRAGLPISHIHLKTCLRAELKSIIEFADLVKEGQADQAINLLNQSREGVHKLKLNPDQNLAQKELIAYLLPLFPSYIESQMDPKEIFKSFNALRLLSPVRKGLFGVNTLNQIIQNAISQKKVKSSWLTIPIMISTNDHNQNLFNGDTGVLLRKFPFNRSESEDYALFSDPTDANELRRISAFLLPKYELAYCLSVHKSQGSEFDRVILVLPEGSELFGRKILYTAVTRARKLIEIWGADGTLKKTILNHETRLSNISTRFTQLWKDRQQN